MSIIDSIHNNDSSYAKITRDLDIFRVTINQPYIGTMSFFAKPIEESAEVSKYTSGFSNISSKFIGEYTYFPRDELAFFEAIKKRKVYGVLDSLGCGGYALTILQRCQNQCIDVSIPILFCLCCDKGSCNFLEDEGCCFGRNNFRRQIVSIYTKRSRPVFNIQLTVCIPPQIPENKIKGNKIN
jgi:hypothetical protein